MRQKTVVSITHYSYIHVHIYAISLTVYFSRQVKNTQIVEALPAFVLGAGVFMKRGVYSIYMLSPLSEGGGGYIYTAFILI
jgi:hypothetical protein